jgi:hypothetical protein
MYYWWIIFQNDNNQEKLDLIMTQEEKDLLLRDLLPRLQYEVKIHTWYGEIVTSDINTFSIGYDEIDIEQLAEMKPYLRSLSSMTEEEKKELSKKYVWNIWTGQIQIRYHSQGCWDDETECPTEEYIELFNWLNAHHFDYRRLIEKGLAIEAPEGMYNII